MAAIPGRPTAVRRARQRPRRDRPNQAGKAGRSALPPSRSRIAECGRDRRSRTSARTGSAAASLRSARSCARLRRGGWFGYDWWTVGRFTVSTDDAYVQAYNNTLAAKVAGYIANVPSRTTPSSRRRCDRHARRRRLSARRRLRRATRSRPSRRPSRGSAIRSTPRTRPSPRRRRSWFRRSRRQTHGTRARPPEHARCAGFRQPADARTGAGQPRPGHRRRASAQAAIDSAAANVDVLKGQQQEAVGTLDELKTALAKAERDLSFTVIRAPLDGVIGNRAVQTGDYVQTGTAAREPRAARRGLCRCQLQGDAIGAATARPAGLDRGRRATRGRIQARSKASRRPPARCSRCCRRITPPETSPRSCSGFRCACVPPALPREGLLRPGMSVVVSVNTKVSCACRRRHAAAEH